MDKHLTAAELLKAVRDATPFEDDEISPALDDVVHDLKAEEAADIDNGGIERQVEYIMDNLGPDETKRILKEIIGG